MADYIVRATAADGQIRAYAATTRDLVEHARDIHNTSPVATAALGRLLTAAGIMGSMMKGDRDSLTLQIKCDGPIGGITVTADAAAGVKGYVYHPDVMLPPTLAGKLDVGNALGSGVLNIVRDMGLKEPYVCQTPLTTGEIAEDIAYYYASSEQIPSSVALGVLMNKNNTVRSSGGLISQLMPLADDAIIDKLESNIGKMRPITTLLDEGMTPEMILEEVLDGLSLEIKDVLPTMFSCKCSRERAEKAVAVWIKKQFRK